MSDTQIRLMNPEDFDTVYALWRATPGMGLNDIDDTPEGIARFLARNPGCCFVAEHEERIVGVILSGHDGRRGFIYHMAVHPSMRKQGIGTNLLKHATAALHAQGIHKAMLVVLEHNELGNTFWEGQGFFRRTDLVYRNRELTASSEC